MQSVDNSLSVHTAWNSLVRNSDTIGVSPGATVQTVPIAGQPLPAATPVQASPSLCVACSDPIESQPLPASTQVQASPSPSLPSGIGPVIPVVRGSDASSDADSGIDLDEHGLSPDEATQRFNAMQGADGQISKVYIFDLGVGNNLPDKDPVELGPNDKIIYMTESAEASMVPPSQYNVNPGASHHNDADGPVNEAKCVCYNCFKVDTAQKRLKRCSRCHIARYCSTTCQAAHWGSHKTTCEAMKAQREKPWLHVASTIPSRLQCQQCMRVHEVNISMKCPFCSGPSRGLADALVAHQSMHDWKAQIKEDIGTHGPTAGSLDAIDAWTHEREMSRAIKAAHRAQNVECTAHRAHAWAMNRASKATTLQHLHSEC